MRRERLSQWQTHAFGSIHSRGIIGLTSSIALVAVMISSAVLLLAHWGSTSLHCEMGPVEPLESVTRGAEMW
jgi:hypothetical protein